jgi:hypothetical protein
LFGTSPNTPFKMRHNANEYNISATLKYVYVFYLSQYETGYIYADEHIYQLVKHKIKAVLKYTGAVQNNHSNIIFATVKKSF